MHLSWQILPLVPLCITGVLADFLGPTYPAPTDLTSSESLVLASFKNLTAAFDSHLKSNASTKSSTMSGIENATFSLGLFSIHDPAAAELQYHYTTPDVAESNGTDKVDGDSIYRIASLSKLFTVFAGLLELTDDDWNRPLSQIIPGLAVNPSTGEQDPAYKAQWDKITPWALANQIAGVSRQGSPAADSLYTYKLVSLLDEEVAAQMDPVALYGFPPLELGELGRCTDFEKPMCEQGDYIDSIDSLPPSFLPWTTPAYANNGFILLGIAISNILGKPIETIYRETIFEPLGMTSSNSTYPTDEAKLSRSVFSGDPTRGFAFEGGITTPSGGLFSTVKDLAKFGVAILNSTLLSAEQTRKWMKPSSHTASLTYSLGAPWEIIRYIHPSTGKVTDIYTKIGDSGFYSSILILLPDYDAGFSAINTFPEDGVPGTLLNIVLDHVTQAILPSLEAQAQAEAASNFVGTYASTDKKLNSSVTIAFNESTIPGTPSLSVTSWISNSTDVLESQFKGVKPRLLLSIPGQGNGQVAFQLSRNVQTNNYEAGVGAGLATGPFTAHYATNFDWFTVDGSHYGGRGVNLFVFDVDGEGAATGVSPAVTRVKLERKY